MSTKEAIPTWIAEFQSGLLKGLLIATPACGRLAMTEKGACNDEKDAMTGIGCVYGLSFLGAPRVFHRRVIMSFLTDQQKLERKRSFLPPNTRGARARRGDWVAH
ncbi:MAG: hypothetical protein IKS49_07770 [Actinomycetaceae bacterium]|nr:hypothetical protein [Actinomycetaceae bacterium]